MKEKNNEYKGNFDNFIKESLDNSVFKLISNTAVIYLAFASLIDIEFTFITIMGLIATIFIVYLAFWCAFLFKKTLYSAEDNKQQYKFDIRNIGTNEPNIELLKPMQIKPKRPTPIFESLELVPNPEDLILDNILNIVNAQCMKSREKKIA